MGMQMNGARGRGRVVSEINVTPLVDVMLVLLIIFMVAAPMMIQGIDVNLPATAARPIPTETKKLTVTIAAEGKVYVDETEVALELLGARLLAMQKDGEEKRGVILRADRKVEYGLVARIMGAIREAGIEEIGMVTEPLAGGAEHPVPEGSAATPHDPGSPLRSIHPGREGSPLVPSGPGSAPAHPFREGSLP